MTNIFVFGSNLAGRHGKGAAKWALEHCGAIYGIGIGLQGNSYAIPTKDNALRTLPIEAIKYHVDYFLYFAQHHPNMEFQLTPIGCGLAGYAYTDIAPLFEGAPPNVKFPKEFIF